MDDEDEIQSDASDCDSRSASPYQSSLQSQSPPPSNGRNDAAAAQRPRIVALALPTQQARPSNGGGGGREDCWSEGATAVLIDAWGERYMELSRGNLKQKHWQEVADIVSSREDYSKVPKTDVQCKNRIDTVKKKFKLEKAKILSGSGSRSSWPFFERLDRLIGSTVKLPALNAPSPAISASKSKFPSGKILVRLRSKSKKQNVNNRSSKSRVRKRCEDSSSEEEEEEERDLDLESDDSLPPEKKPRAEERREGRGVEREGSMRMLTQAIVKLGEVYEQAENATLLQVVEMEKSRMKFAKELELQRMEFFVKTQMEISQLRHGGGRGGKIGSRGASAAQNRHTSTSVDVVNNDVIDK